MATSLTGRIPERKRKQPEEVDWGIVEKYGIAMSKYARHRRRRAGEAAVEFHRALRGYLVNQAVLRSSSRLAQEFYELPVELFGPVQRQLRKLLREVNAERKTAGLSRIPGRVIPCWLRIVRLTDCDPPSNPSLGVEPGHGMMMSGGV